VDDRLRDRSGRLGATRTHGSGQHRAAGRTGHRAELRLIERNWSLQTITRRSRDNLPNPIVNATNPYAPTNMAALTDLFDVFDFSLVNQ